MPRHINIKITHSILFHRDTFMSQRSSLSGRASGASTCKSATLPHLFSQSGKEEEEQTDAISSPLNSRLSAREHYHHGNDDISLLARRFRLPPEHHRQNRDWCDLRGGV
jgi:hypothetical protein